MCKENGFWGKVKRKFARDEEPETLPHIKIPKIEMMRTSFVETEPTDEIDPIFLRQQMSNHLEDSELVAISAKFGVDYTELPGGKGRKVLELINQIQQQSELDQLLTHCQQIKPDVSWQLNKIEPKGLSND